MLTTRPTSRRRTAITWVDMVDRPGDTKKPEKVLQAYLAAADGLRDFFLGLSDDMAYVVAQLKEWESGSGKEMHPIEDLFYLVRRAAYVADSAHELLRFFQKVDPQGLGRLRRK